MSKIMVLRHVSCPGADHWVTLHKEVGRLCWLCPTCNRFFTLEEVKKANPDLRLCDYQPYCDSLDGIPSPRKW